MKKIFEMNTMMRVMIYSSSHAKEGSGLLSGGQSSLKYCLLSGLFVPERFHWIGHCRFCRKKDCR
jgi:hypothetical protein